MIINVNGCVFCGVLDRDHGRRYDGLHPCGTSTYQAPSNALRKTRLLLNISLRQMRRGQGRVLIPLNLAHPTNRPTHPIRTEGGSDMTLEELAKRAFAAYERSPQLRASLDRMRIKTTRWEEMHEQSREAWIDAVDQVIRDLGESRRQEKLAEFRTTDPTDPTPPLPPPPLPLNVDVDVHDMVGDI